MRQKRIRSLLAAGCIIMTALAAGCTPMAETAGGEGEESMAVSGADVWMYAASVGKADAVLISADGHTCLVDTGYDYSRGRITGAMKQMGVEKLDAVFVTHLDNDHTGGLEWLAESGPEIGAWYASAMYLDVKDDEEHPVARAAGKRGQEAVFLKAGDQVPLGSAVLKVLAPMKMFWDKDDNNSLVMMLESSQGRILLTGDMEYPAEGLLLRSGADLKCDVLKVANHADDDTTSPQFVQAALPKAAVISTSSAEKPETPDPGVVSLLKNAGAGVWVTEDCTGGILVRLKNGVPEVTLVNAPEPDSSVRLTEAVAGKDLVRLTADRDTDLSGWYLRSDRGREMFAFPEGTVIRAGQTLTVGTRSSGEGSYDLFWDDKKVIHAKKEDLLILYDCYGSEVSRVSNGL